jgi:YfiH family protein
MVSLPSPPHWLQAEGWDRVPGLIHGFSSRIHDRGLVSARLQGTHGGLCTLKQIHGDTIVMVSSETHQNDTVEADGMITTQPGLLLGIATADCVPVLMVAPQHNVVVALHAGWRGTLKGITAQAVARLRSVWKINPQDLQVALGPSIDSCCYEVGRDIGDTLYEQWGHANPETWKPKGEKGFLHLRAINQLQCEQAGVPRTRIQQVGPCTYCDSSLFTSYRREGGHADRQLSILGWQVVGR